MRPAAADRFLRFYLAGERFQNEPPPPPWVVPLEEVWVELPPESLELDSFGRSVRCTSRYRNRSRWLVSFMLPCRT